MCSTRKATRKEETKMSEMMYAEAEKSAETMEKAVFPAYSVLMSV